MYRTLGTTEVERADFKVKLYKIFNAPRVRHQCDYPVLSKLFERRPHQHVALPPVILVLSTPTRGVEVKEGGLRLQYNFVKKVKKEAVTSLTKYLFKIKNTI